MKIKKIQIFTLIVQLLFGLTIKTAEQREIHVIPIKYNTIEHYWEALLGLTATVYQGTESFHRLRFWESFRIKKEGLETIPAIVRTFNNFGLEIAAGDASNAVRKNSGNQTYYFITVPFTDQTRSRAIYDSIQAYNKTLVDQAEAQEKRFWKELENRNVSAKRMEALQHTTPTIESIVDIRWIPVQEIINAPQSQTFGFGRRASRQHEIDPRIKSLFQTQWADIEREASQPH